MLHIVERRCGKHITGSAERLESLDSVVEVRAASTGSPDLPRELSEESCYRPSQCLIGTHERAQWRSFLTVCAANLITLLALAGRIQLRSRAMR